jgi:zona occludens toxin
MSIVAYVGRPRSGKSYGVVENIIIPALKLGRTVITNIPLKTGYLKDDYPKGTIVQFKPNEPLENPDFFNLDRHAGAIWIIDEAWRYWSTGTKATQIPELQKSFFTEHGHCVGDDGKTTEIVLVTQSLDQVANFARELIEDTYRATKLSALGLSKSYRIDVFTGCQKGLSGGTPNRTLQGSYKPEVYKYYISHTKNKTDFAAGMEEKVDKRNNIFKSKLFMFGIPLALLAIIFGITNVLSYFGRNQEKPAVTPQKSENFKLEKPNKTKNHIKQDRSTIAAKRMLESDISREFLPLSESYRIVGSINNSLMLWSDKGSRVVDRKRCGNFSNTNEDYCVLNGELVTWYSSVIPQQDNEDNYFGETIEKVF